MSRWRDRSKRGKGGRTISATLNAWEAHKRTICFALQLISAMRTKPKWSPCEGVSKTSASDPKPYPPARNPLQHIRPNPHALQPKTTLKSAKKQPSALPKLPPPPWVVSTPKHSTPTVRDRHAVPACVILSDRRESKDPLPSGLAMPHRRGLPAVSRATPSCLHCVQDDTTGRSRNTLTPCHLERSPEGDTRLRMT